MQGSPSRNELLLRLARSPELAARGFEAEVAGLRDVVITRGSHFQGMWRRGLGTYEWIPAGYNTPQHRSLSADDAARYTVRALCTS